MHSIQLSSSVNMDFHSYYQGYHTPMDCRVTLENNDLWKKFHSHDTEMIITKSGRKMFPSISIKVSNLDPKAQYCIFLEMVPSSRCRYKYGNSGGWTPAGTEEAQSPQRVYLHPESPANGEYWMSRSISFDRLKLTNTISPPAGHIVLSSMHKYQPRIIIALTSDPRSVIYAPSFSTTFPETEFIAVTAYQNEKVTLLKIDNNPFAKGFRQDGRANRKRKRRGSESKSDEETSQKRTKIDRLPLVNLEDDHLSSSSCSSPCSTTNSSPTIYPQRVYSTIPTYFPAYVPPTQHFFPYYPYPVMSNEWNLPVLPVSHVQNSLYQPGFAAPPVEKPKKTTDFSIRAILST